MSVQLAQQMSGNIQNTINENKALKERFILQMDEAKSYWQSDSAKLFFDQCKDIIQTYISIENQLNQLHNQNNILVNAIRTADAERAARAAAERLAAAKLAAEKQKAEQMKSKQTKK